MHLTKLNDDLFLALERLFGFKFPPNVKKLTLEIDFNEVPRLTVEHCVFNEVNIPESVEASFEVRERQGG